MFEYGDRVVWDTEETGVPIGEGVVCGIGMAEQPVIGCGYLINVGHIISEDYPYDTVLVWGSRLKSKGE